MTHLDQLGNRIELITPPRRIVSLVPSITELLCDLGLRDRLVGCTKFCVHPKGLWDTCRRVGGTKNVRVDAVRTLQPDLIIANKEENERATVEALRSTAPVWVSHVPTVTAANAMIARLGELTDRTGAAARIIAENDDTLRRARLSTSETALYLIWQKPWMAAGGDTYISDVMRAVGLENVLADEVRYPELTRERMTALAPQRILLSSEPFPFRERHQAELQQLFPASRVELVDGEFFSWYGSRLSRLTGGFSGSASPSTP